MRSILSGESFQKSKNNCSAVHNAHLGQKKNVVILLLASNNGIRDKGLYLYWVCNV